MNFENRPTHSLRPYSGNARTHSPKQIKQIARSIERFGFNNPVLVDDDDQIMAGHGRVEAAKLLNMKTVPTVRLSHLSESAIWGSVCTQESAYVNGWPVSALMMMPRGSSFNLHARTHCAPFNTVGVFGASGLSKAWCASGNSVSLASLPAARRRSK